MVVGSERGPGKEVRKLCQEMYFWALQLEELAHKWIIVANHLVLFPGGTTILTITIIII